MGKHSSKLAPKQLRDLQKMTRFEEQEIKECYKNFLKDNPRGCITKDQFLEMYRNFFPNGDPVPFAQHVFRTYDRNRDGEVDFREFLCALSVSSRGTIQEKLRLAFCMYDLDGNGYITRDEILAVIKSVYLLARENNTSKMENPEARTDYILRKLDTNRDGRLSIDEFIAGARHEPAVVNLLESLSEEGPNFD